jgi:hypothetical protein
MSKAGPRINPSRIIAIKVGEILCGAGRLLAWPGETIGNFGIWVSNLGCDCPLCQANRDK